jgi:ATP-binding cassette, subfamily B, bacterial PglK
MSILLPKQTNTSQCSLSSLLWRLWCHLSRRRQLQFGLALLLMLISAFAEMVSLGTVIPFLGVLVAPDKVLSHPLAVRVASVFGITSPADLLLPCTIAFAVAAVVAGGIRMLLLWSNTRLAYASGSDISFDVYRRTLYQPYQVHLARNSSEVSSGLDYKVSYAVNVLLQSLNLASSVVLLGAILVALLAIDAAVTSMAAIGFGVFYALISWVFRNKLRTNAQRIARESTQVVKAVQEGLGGIRDVLLDGTQPFYCDVYRRADSPLRLAMGNNIFIGGSPRFVMEAAGMVLIVVLAYNLSHQVGGIASSLPVLGALALGAQRLLPALQQSYAAWASIVGSQTALAETLEFLDQSLPVEALQPAPAPLSLQTAIRLNAVRFRYGSESPWVLDGFNLSIQKGARVGVVGGTGSGKSTMLDLLMGLMEPSEGQILVDELPISGERRRAWQRTIAHVPQSIYLADTTVAENIAFGVPREEIDMERVRQAARQARIADFVESHAEGYNLFVGERGVRLSGGQRQRIGIARALYKQVTVLVFDEATSALDNATEQEVMNAIEGLNRDLTIVIVAHRLTTVKRCDSIFEIYNGQVVAQGTYEHLLECSMSFRKMALATE